MEQSLMDKEVLCILDTRQIQRYMFRTNTIQDTMGASDLLDHVLEDAIQNAMTEIEPPLSPEQYDLSLRTDEERLKVAFTRRLGWLRNAAAARRRQRRRKGI